VPELVTVTVTQYSGGKQGPRSGADSVTAAGADGTDADAFTESGRPFHTFHTLHTGVGGGTSPQLLAPCPLCLVVEPGKEIGGDVPF
jgi:hypothetical protein